VTEAAGQRAGRERMEQRPTQQQLKWKKARTGLILASIAVAFFIGMIVRHLTK
jgi:hypothetical protein